ncbi:putative T7SS-secreted protein [Kitasatospora indigofera]|uniref:putative T7SS-secreted protein n=1 Tax=Kitasatospora indigofera TaxID=67307 RepID=UPI00368DEF92
MGGFPGLGVTVPRDRPGFEGIGFDPAPGDTGGVEALAGDLRQAAKEIDDARKIVARVSHKGGDWQGGAADSFSARISKLPAQLDTAHASFTTAYTALHSWRDQLADLQHRAADDEKQAEAARTRLATARSNPDLKLAGQWLPDDLVEDATLRFKTASADLQVATGELNQIIARAEALRHQHDQLATEAAVAVKRAGDQAPDGPGWFGHLMDEVHKVVTLHIQLAEDAAAWARAHANSIAAVGDLLSNASTLTGLASIALAGAGVFFPPLEIGAAALNGASMALSGAALGFHGVAAAAGADVPLLSFAVDVMGMVPVVGELGKAAPLAVSLYERQVLGTGVGLGATGLSLGGWSQDPSGLEQFLPRGPRQWGELLLPGGVLGIGMENAWKDGSAKDDAAVQDG